MPQQMYTHVVPKRDQSATIYMGAGWLRLTSFVSESTKRRVSLSTLGLLLLVIAPPSLHGWNELLLRVQLKQSWMIDWLIAFLSVIFREELKEKRNQKKSQKINENECN